MREREIDDTYAAVAEATAAKKKARKAAHTAPALAPPLPDEEADGARGISQVCRGGHQRMSPARLALTACLRRGDGGLLLNLDTYLNNLGL